MKRQCTLLLSTAFNKQWCAERRSHNKAVGTSATTINKENMNIALRYRLFSSSLFLRNPTNPLYCFPSITFSKRYLFCLFSFTFVLSSSSLSFLFSLLFLSFSLISSYLFLSLLLFLSSLF